MPSRRPSLDHLLDELALGEAELDDHVADPPLDPGLRLVGGVSPETGNGPAEAA